MSKRESIARYSIIIKKLRKYPATFQEIMNELDLESEIQSYNYRVSKRTFQRDIADIRSIYNIDIQYDFSRGLYHIKYDDQSDLSERILEAFDTLTALNIADRLSNHINFEKRKPKGTENLYGVLHAIKNKLLIKFNHQKFSDKHSTIRKVEPHALKEFGNRWYLMAVDIKDNKIKSFAFDRMDKLVITEEKFISSNQFDVYEHYKHCFGIVSPNGKKPQEVILSFNKHQGKYIKSLPLHDSQHIISENDKEMVFGLNVVLTEDFIMEILSHGDRVRVVKPDNLINILKVSYEKALAQY